MLRKSSRGISERLRPDRLTTEGGGERRGGHRVHTKDKGRGSRGSEEDSRGRRKRLRCQGELRQLLPKPLGVTDGTSPGVGRRNQDVLVLSPSPAVTPGGSWMKFSDVTAWEAPVTPGEGICWEVEVPGRAEPHGEGSHWDGWGRLGILAETVLAVSQLFKGTPPVLPPIAHPLPGILPPSPCNYTASPRVVCSHSLASNDLEGLEVEVPVIKGCCRVCMKEDMKTMVG